MTDRALEELAARVEACVDDVKRPDVIYSLQHVERRLMALANGLEAVAAALRAIASAPDQQEECSDRS